MHSCIAHNLLEASLSILDSNMADDLERVRQQLSAALLSRSAVNSDIRGTVPVHDEPVGDGGVEIHAGRDTQYAYFAYLKFE